MEQNSEQGDLLVGRFSIWLNELIGSLKGENDADVPCGDCVGCCTSSYFIHIKPTDSQTIKHVPKEIMFPAPGLPKGHYLMGYDENGHCPMFKQGKCSIYAYRPETCRQYDCRIFPATGLSLEGENRPLITGQAKRWRFDFADKQDEELFQAMQSAGVFILDYEDYFPSGFVPNMVSQKAVMAIRIHELFIGLSRDEVENRADRLVDAIVQKFAV